MTTTNMFLNFGGKWDSPPMAHDLRCILLQNLKEIENQIWEVCVHTLWHTIVMQPRQEQNPGSCLMTGFSSFTLRAAVSNP